MNIPGERLSSFVEIWENLKASPEVLNILKLIFKSRPDLSFPLKSHETVLPAQAMKITRKELADLLHKGALRVVPKDESEKVKGF